MNKVWNKVIMNKDKFLTFVFDELENKYPKMVLTQGINNKQTYFKADNVFEAIEKSLKESNKRKRK